MDGRSFLRLSIKRSPDLSRHRPAWNPHRQLAHLVNLDAAAVLVSHGDWAEVWVTNHGLIDGFNAHFGSKRKKPARGGPVQITATMRKGHVPRDMSTGSSPIRLITRRFWPAGRGIPLS